MWRHIIVPLDGSALAEFPLTAALALARRAGAAVVLVRAHVSIPEPGNERHGDAVRRDEEEDYLSQVRDRIFPFSHAAARLELLDGEPAGAIARFVEGLDDVLIVMATHGRTGLRRTLLGSTADRLLRRTEAPVLLFHPATGTGPAPVQECGFNRIVVALDGTRHSERLLEPAAELALLSGASLHLVHVVPTPALPAPVPFGLPVDGGGALAADLEVSEWSLQRGTDRVRAAFPEVPLSHETVLDTRASRGVLACAREQHADVVALAPYETLASRWFAGSVTNQLLHHGPRALLVVNPRPVAGGAGRTRPAVGARR